MRKHLSYANVTATLALVFAMSGGALAANHYLITSTKQIKPSVLAKLKGNAGAAGLKGATGAAGASGATGPAGAKGETGLQGSPGQSALSPLPSGQSVSGEYGAESSASTGVLIDPVSFPIPLSSAIPSSHVIFTTTAGTTHCSGPGHAEAGYLCFYSVKSNDVTSETAYNLEVSPLAATGTGRFGVLIQWGIGVSSEPYDNGTYTVTAP
jgi:hypothetical protein